MKTITARSLLCLLACLCGSFSLLYSQAANVLTPASPAIVRAGGLSFTLPPPSNDLVEAGPDYRVVLEPLAPVNNRLIAAFVMPEVMSVLRTGGFPPLHEYALVEVPRRAEFADVTPEVFAQITGAMKTQLAGEINGTLQEQQDEVNRRLKNLGSTNSVSLQNPVQLGEFFSKPNAAAFGMIMPVSSKDRTVKMAMSAGVLRVHNRVLVAYIFSEYKDPNTISHLRAMSEQWADSILRANP